MRTKVYFEYVVNKHATDNYICFDKEQIELYDYDNNTYKKYKYSEIDRINISICSRAFSNTIRNNEIERVEFFSTGLVTRFFIDIDIKINNSLYQYESMSLENMKEISNILSLKENVDDKLNLLSLFQKETSIEEINKQLLANIKKWEKEFHIDNPRSIEVQNQVESLQKNMVKNNNFYGPLKRISMKRMIISYTLLALAILLYFIFK